VGTQERRSVRYSQNFLHDRRLVGRLLARSSIGPDDVVYEIGPGRGIITEALAARCRRVVAVEKDPLLAARLQRRFAGWTAYIFSGDPDIARLIRLQASRRTVLYNGALECRLYEYRMVSGGNRRTPKPAAPRGWIRRWHCGANSRVLRRLLRMERGAGPVFRGFPRNRTADHVLPAAGQC